MGFTLQILESGNFQNGQPHGNWEYFYDHPVKNTKNSIKEKGAFVNGKKNGIWMYYYMDTIPEITKQDKFGKRNKADSIKIFIDQQSAKVRAIGMYLNDNRVGEWTSFSRSGAIIQKYNFTKKTLLFDNSINDSSAYNTNRRALFVGGASYMSEVISYQFNGGYLDWEQIKKDSSSIVAAVPIDKNGNMVKATILTSTANAKLENEIIRLVQSTNKNWIPAISESKPIESVYKFRFIFIKKDISPTHKALHIFVRPIFE